MRNILFFDYRSIEMAFYFLSIFLDLDKLGTFRTAKMEIRKLQIPDPFSSALGTKMDAQAR